MWVYIFLQCTCCAILLSPPLEYRDLQLREMLDNKMTFSKGQCPQDTNLSIYSSHTHTHTHTHTPLQNMCVRVCVFEFARLSVSVSLCIHPCQLEHVRLRECVGGRDACRIRSVRDVWVGPNVSRLRRSGCGVESERATAKSSQLAEKEHRGGGGSDGRWHGGSGSRELDASGDADHTHLHLSVTLSFRFSFPCRASKWGVQSASAIPINSCRRVFHETKSSRARDSLIQRLKLAAEAVAGHVIVSKLLSLTFDIGLVVHAGMENHFSSCWKLLYDLLLLTCFYMG